MKCLKCLMTLLALLLIFTACSAKTSVDEDVVDENATTTETGDQDMSQEENQADVEVVAEENEADMDGEEEAYEGEFDVSLLDRALLSSITIKYPDTSEITYESYSEWTYDEEVTKSNETRKLYSRGFDTREETTDEGETDIDIYLYEEGVRYSYDLGEETGYIYYDDEEDRALKETEVAFEGESLLEYLEMALELEEDIELNAWRDKVAGRNAVCVELIYEEEDDEGNAIENSWRIWFDSKYLVLLKYEMFWGDSYGMQEAVDVKINKRIDDDLFLPPEDVDFQ